jgi:hypothetical protein
LEQLDVQDGLNNCSRYFDCEVLLFGCKIVEDIVFATFVVEPCFNFLNDVQILEVMALRGILVVIS